MTIIPSTPLAVYQCEPWCDELAVPVDGRDPDHDHCERSIGRTIISHTPEGGSFEISISRSHTAPPAGCSVEVAAETRRRHGDVVRIALSRRGEPPLLILLDLGPGEARSLAAALTHGADQTERLAP